MTNPELTLRELNTIAEALYSAYLVKMNEFKNENNLTFKQMIKLDKENQKLNSFPQTFTKYLIALKKIEQIKEYKSNIMEHLEWNT